MKKKFKFLFFGSIFVFLLIGCGSKNSDSIIKSLEKKLDKSDSYYISGVMEIINNEDTYTYDVTVSYKKDNYYKVNLVNKLNNHEQVILRNDDGVYVVTPSLNKSFKFQSDWPYNNSQVYLLHSIINDLKKDDNRVFNSKKSGYLLSSLVNYPNNKSLVKQNVFLDNKLNISRVEVTDKNNKVQILMKFEKIKFNKKFDNDYFELSNLITISNKNTNDSNKKNDSVDTNNNSQSGNNSQDSNSTNSEDASTNTSNNQNSNNNTNNNQNSNNDQNSNNNTNNNQNTTKDVVTIDDVIYPMYLPDNTMLANKEVINTNNGKRLILTFDGDNPFTLVEEVASYQDEGLIIPVSGDLDFLTDVIGVIGDNSLTWESNGTSYYLVSDVIETAELIEIAQSINVIPVSK